MGCFALAVDWTAVGTIGLAAATVWLALITKDSLEVSREELAELRAREQAARNNYKKTALGLVLLFQDELEKVPREMSHIGTKIAAEWDPDDFSLLLNSAHESHELPVVPVHRLVVNFRWLRSAAIANRTSSNPLIMFDGQEWTRRCDSSMETLQALAEFT